MVWIAVVIGVVLLFVFPKQMGILFGVVVAGIAGIYLYDEAERNARIKERELVSVSVRFDTTHCSEQYPLLVSVKNNGSKTINSVSWNIGAYRPGYSSNVVKYTYANSEYSTPYSSDKITAPGQGYSLCYQPPQLNGEYQLQSLNWSVIRKSINFQSS